CRPFEGHDADALLHLAHRDADRGLRDAEALRNRRHVVLLRKCDERTDASLVGQHAEYRSIAYAALGRESSELATCALRFTMRPPRTHEKRATALRKEHAPRAAFEELDPEVAFQLVNRTRNRG